MRTNVAQVDEWPWMTDARSSGIPSRQNRYAPKVTWATAVTAIVAVLSLAVSCLNYWDAHQAGQRVYADKVTYWLTGSGNNTQVEVRNGGDAPISNASVNVVSVSPESYPQGSSLYMVDGGLETSVSLPTIPPCSALIANALNTARIELVEFNSYDTEIPQAEKPQAVNPATIPGVPTGVEVNVRVPISLAIHEMQLFEKANGFPVSIKSLTFTDANDLTWLRNRSGIHPGGVELPQYPNVPNFQIITTPDGCS